MSAFPMDNEERLEGPNSVTLVTVQALLSSRSCVWGAAGAGSIFRNTLMMSGCFSLLIYHLAAWICSVLPAFSL